MRAPRLTLGIRIILFTILTGVLIFQTLPVFAQTLTPANKVYIYFFYGEGCPHCAKAKPYFEGLAASHPEIELVSFEVYYSEENQLLFSLMAQHYGIDSFAVPTIFIGPYYLQGYSEEINPQFEEIINACIASACPDLGEGVIKNIPTSTATPAVTPTSSSLIYSGEITYPTPSAQTTTTANQPENLNTTTELNLPLFGKVDLASKSTLLSTILIALVDGFNPCSLWVLTMLLALTLHTGSRKKVFLIGIIFLTVTALIYALFIAGLFSLLKITSYMVWIRILVAIIALIFAVVNIKDYFWYKEGLSFTISDDKKPGLFKRMRNVLDASQSFTGLVGATIALAAGVSLVEFSCTAGFPVVWTNILTAQNVDGTTFILLLLLYMLIYQADELLIFCTSVVTLKASRLEEKHGRLLKLISGVLMFTLSVIMITNPALLNDLVSSLIIFGMAFLVTFIIYVIHRFILPKLGIRFGSSLEDENLRTASSHNESNQKGAK
jgi:thiol-disulfide isomerase/thioredoxin